MARRRTGVARFANLGLAFFGLGLVIILGTGGTRIQVLGLGLDIHHLSNPLLGFAVFAALRLLVATRDAGLEARVVGFFARSGLPPRDSPATAGSSARSGALLGLGWGLVCASVDVAHHWLVEGARVAPAESLVTVAAIGLALGVTLGSVAGLVAGAALFALGRLLGRRVGRYQVGRWTLAMLWVLGALVVRLAPPAADPFDRRPAVLLTGAAVFVAATAITFFVGPAAILRARRGRWGLAVVGGGGLALGLGLVAVGAFGPASGRGAARDSHHPNILVVTIPGVRLEVIGSYHDGMSLTPTIDALTTRGTMFVETVTPATEAVPAAGSMLTGLYPSTHGVTRRDASWRWPTGSLTEMLSAHGYQTGAFIGADELDGERTRLADLFDRYDDLVGLGGRVGRLALARVVRRDARGAIPATRPSAETAAAFGTWLSDLPPGPWFAWVQLADALRPDPVSAEGRESVAARELGVTAGLGEPLVVPPSWARGGRARAPLGAWFAGYDAAVRSADDALASILGVLERRGDTKRTVVTVLAEHGISIGEEGCWFERGPGLPEGLIHVPWVVTGPGVVSEGFVPGPTSLVDVAPTLLGLVGLGGGRFYEGEDLSRYLLTRGSVRSYRSGPVFIVSAPHPRYDGDRLRAVRLGPWKLVRTPGGQERLFFVSGGGESEISTPRGRAERQLVALSDLLTGRLAEQARLYGIVE